MYGWVLVACISSMMLINLLIIFYLNALQLWLIIIKYWRIASYKLIKKYKIKKKLAKLKKLIKKYWNRIVIQSPGNSAIKKSLESNKQMLKQNVKISPSLVNDRTKK